MRGERERERKEGMRERRGMRGGRERERGEEISEGRERERRKRI